MYKEKFNWESCRLQVLGYRLKFNEMLGVDDCRLEVSNFMLQV